MASPQTENGFLRVATELALVLCGKKIPTEARQVLDVIIIKTYGFNKKSDWISVGQFQELTKRPHARSIRRAIKNLEDWNMIEVDRSNSRKPHYAIQKNYEMWKACGKL